MRKILALAMVALLALALALAAVSCGQKAAEESTPAPETTTAPADTGSMMQDSTMADTSMHQ
ncbi:MAG: hypothetical protein HZC42_05350 [Candidatus Eisenbacteria bacterium]|nr:hypothetical protein [Candidatus Eisenbacteria bacterium]